MKSRKILWNRRFPKGVSIKIPAILYTEENRKILEKGYLFSRKKLEKKELQGECNEK